jgi:hypothetical protein
MSDGESYLWIGIIQKDDQKDRVAFLTPLAFFNDEFQRWELLVYQTRKRFFPNAGKVAWPLGPVEWTPELLYSFRVEPAYSREDFKDSPTYAQFRIAGWPAPSPEGLAQVLDWSATPRERLVTRLSEPFTRSCYTKTIYIQHGQQLYGPIHLDEQRRRPLAYTDGSTEQTLYVTVSDLDEEAMITLALDNGERLRLLTIEPAGSKQEDWSPPGVIIKQVIAAYKQPLVRDHAFDQTLHSLKTLKYDLSSQTPMALALRPNTLARARALLEDEVQAISALEQFSDFLLQLPAVQQLLAAACEKACQQAYQEAQEQARQNMAQFRREQEEAITRELEARFAEQCQRLADGQKQLDDLEKSIDEAKTALAIYEDEIENKNRSIQNYEEKAREIGEQLQQRLEELRRQPLAILSQALMGRWLLEASTSAASTDFKRGSDTGSRSDSRTGATHHHHHHSTEALWPELSDARPIEAITDAEQLLSLATIRPAALGSGVLPEAVRCCIVALLAGLIPTLSGPYALATLEALSLVLSAGRLCRVPIPLSATQPRDLFGQLSTTGHLFLPDGSFLADTVLWAADHREQLVIVILEGLDRVPGVPVYVPLLQQYIEMQRRPTATPTSVPLFHPQVLPLDNPYRPLAAFRWPPNLLLTATCDCDLHSLALPQVTRGWLAYPKPGPQVSQLFQHQSNGVPARREVMAQNWRDWRLTVNKALAEAAYNGESAGALAAITAILKRTADCFHCGIDIERAFSSAAGPASEEAGAHAGEVN